MHSNAVSYPLLAVISYLYPGQLSPVCTARLKPELVGLTLLDISGFLPQALNLFIYLNVYYFLFDFFPPGIIAANDP